MPPSVKNSSVTSIEPKMTATPACLLSFKRVTVMRECYPLVRQGSSISILGRENWNVFELRSLLGIVSPDLLASCTTDATGRDVVLSGFFSSTRIFPHHHPDPEHLARAEAALERLGIAHLADRPVAHMSSGEAKRTLIARALVHD